MGAKAVIFDKDGVIIDTKAIHHEVLIDFIEELGFSITDEEYNSFMGITSIELFKRLNSKYQRNYDVDALVDSFQRRYIDTIRDNKDIRPIRNVDILIKKLYNNKVKLAVASSAKREKIELVLSRFDLTHYFEVLVSGYEVNNSKPHPDIFLRTAEKLGVSPRECIVIEDSANGVRAAKAAGMICVGYKNPASKQNLCEADFVMDDFNEFPMDILTK